MRLVDQPCTKSVLQCEYHGRTFDLDGVMKHMSFQQAIGFPSDSDNLHQFALNTWKGLLFVSQGDEETYPARTECHGFLRHRIIYSRP